MDHCTAFVSIHILTTGKYMSHLVFDCRTHESQDTKEHNLSSSNTKTQ